MSIRFVRQPLVAFRFAAVAALFALVGTALVVRAAPVAQAAPDPCVAPVNVIACENGKAGAPVSEWDVDGSGDETIQGFASDISVNVGSTIQFKINTPASAYKIDIYRTGYYGGNGARKIASVTPSVALPQVQPACLTDVATGLVDCGNWAVSASWAVPANAVSGVYVAHLTRTDTGGDSHIIFVVRDDASTSKILFQTADTTWQAYNSWGGWSLYPGPNGSAVKVSYNRPFNTRSSSPNGRDFYFSHEFAMARWLERNGYDVSYTTGIDSDRYGALLQNHRVFLSVGHDEYWSGQQRANVEAARDAGVNLAFFSGNEVYWKTRYEPSIDASSTAHRTLVCYKETKANAKVDPSSQWTGTWRDPRFSPPSDGGRPENGLTGTAYMVNDADLPLQVPAADGKMRFWRGTSVATQSAGQTATLAPSTLGYEFDEDLDNGVRPAGLVRLSSTTAAVDQYLQDYGSVVAPGTATHHLTMYRAPSGALVFGAGTIQWSWGLDVIHDGAADEATEDVRMQQATVNLLADMTVQPTTLQAGLAAASASTDTTPPTSVITSPTVGATVLNGSVVTVTGTASDVGGQVGGVEVSLDGGQTWHAANGRTSWTYTGSVKGFGPVQIMSRASDDSGNLQSPVTGVQVNASCPCTLFAQAAVPNVVANADNAAIELGLKFTSDADGWITGVRFYKAATNTGTHTGSLWSAGGLRLAQVTFTDETASGWQQADFATPVEISSGTTYVISYFAPNGNYSSDRSYFATARDAAPLHALQDAVQGANGVFRYGTTGGFPTGGFQATNYWVDAVFNTTGPPDSTPPTVLATLPVADATDVDPAAAIKVAFSEPVQASTIVWSVTAGGQPVAGAATYDAAARAATFTPTYALAVNTGYTVTVSGATDRSGNVLAEPTTWSFHTWRSTPGAGECPCTIFGDAVPSLPAVSDPSEIELGVKFRASIDGHVAAVRFYKGSTNSGPHTVTLWSGTGAELATTSAYFESAGGWQTAYFAAPVSVTADTTYVASYHTVTGGYSATPGLLGSAVVNGPLTAPKDGADGGNGVYRYGERAFPTNTYGSTSYAVDVVFTTPPDITPPTVASAAPGANATSVPVGVNPSVTFGEAVTAESLNMTLTGPSGSVPGTAALDATGKVATFTPSAALTQATAYTVTVNAASDKAGNALAQPFSATFTTSGAAACPCTIFASDARPAVPDTNDGAALELGTQFTTETAGWIQGIRFYKGAGNTGTHVGHLWNSSGALLASVTFTGETATGWQNATLSTPVPVAAGATYTVSYWAPAGHYASTSGFFSSSSWVNAPFTAPSGGNGVFATAQGVRPTETFGNTNYWVDAVFTTVAPPDTTAPTVSGTSPVDGATSVPLTGNISVTFSEPVQAASVNLTVKTTSGGTAVPGSTSYDAGTNTATFTPGAALAAATSYQATVSGAQDVAGNVLAAAQSWSFTTATVGSASCPCSIWTDATAPTIPATTDTASVELGMKFRTDTAGTITGARFYKGAGNGGTHTATLWSVDGTELATATFSGESAAGWQQVTFGQPVAVTANTTYVISYHAPVGRYAADLDYFAAGGADTGSLHALAAGADGPNGVYRYGTRAFPTLGSTTNYWVDVLFSPAAA